MYECIFHIFTAFCLFVVVFRIYAACAIILGPFSMEMILNFIQFNIAWMGYISACDDVIYTFFGGYCLCLCFHSSRIESFGMNPHSLEWSRRDIFNSLQKKFGTIFEIIISINFCLMIRNFKAVFKCDFYSKWNFLFSKLNPKEILKLNFIPLQSHTRSLIHFKL